jgi:hypothetical protein
MAINIDETPLYATGRGELNIPTLEEVQEQFIEWRKQRKFGVRIPETLWSHALSLSDSYPIGQITRTLGLGWESFHKRLCQKQGVVYQPTKKRKGNGYPSPSLSTSSPFIELKISESSCSNISPSSPSQSPCLLELANPSGGSLRIYASAVSFLNININGLIDKFLSPQG